MATPWEFLIAYWVLLCVLITAGIILVLFLVGAFIEVRFRVERYRYRNAQKTKGQ